MCCCFSPDGQYLASGGHDRKVLVWNTSDLNNPAHAFEGHTGYITDLRFSSDSRNLVASASFDKTVRVWTCGAQSGNVKALQGHAAAVTSVDFHPTDEDLLCSADVDGELKFWSLNTGTCNSSLKACILFRLLTSNVSNTSN